LACAEAAYSILSFIALGVITMAVVVAPSNAQQAVQDAGREAQDDKMAKLESILARFEITIASAQELAALEDYEIVCIVDDSGSMGLPAAPPAQRQLGKPSRTRWQELQETVSLIIELGACFDDSGIDMFFLNRGNVPGVRSIDDTRFVNAFRAGPSGGTPLTETLGRVAKACGGEKPVLLFILTDGEPNGGVAKFHGELARLVKKQSTPHAFKVQIMACTGDEDAVGWLDKIDAAFSEVDVTDDYYSEMIQVLKEARRVKKFTRGDWCMKAMLGPISNKFDQWDEKSGPRILGREDMFRSATASLEDQCRCGTSSGDCTIS
jgi:hypothetical protein